MATGIVLGGSLYCRKQPQAGADYYGRFSNGTTITVQTISGNNDWYQTTWQGSVGYVMKAYVAVENDTIQVTGTNVNVRNGSSTNNTSVLYMLSSPATARVVTVTSNWVKIAPSGRNAGWISADYVKKYSSGNSSAGSGTISGVRGDGPNSTVSASAIRSGNGIWKKDLDTTYHPQIVQLQRKLNNYIMENWSEGDLNELTLDGCFGENTRLVLLVFQRYHNVSVDGIVGQYTLMKLEYEYGAIL